jgi:hypothetical protein
LTAAAAKSADCCFDVESDQASADRPHHRLGHKGVTPVSRGAPYRSRRQAIPRFAVERNQGESDGCVENQQR